MKSRFNATTSAAILLSFLLAVTVCSGAEPTWTDYWNGLAELQQDIGGIGASFGFHFPSILYEGNEIWAYYIKGYESGGQAMFATGRARSTNGVNWTDGGIVLDIGGTWQWVFQSEGAGIGIGHQIGRADGDGWSANVAQDNEGYLCYGPYTTAVAAGKNCASFKLMIDSNSGTDTAVTLDVYDATAGQILASKAVKKSEFSALMTYQVFNLNFTSTAGNQLEFRTYWHKKAYVKQDLAAISQGHYPFWDARMASFPGIWKDNGVYYLVYEGSGGSGWPGDIGLATSTDGRNFLKHPNNPILKHNTTGWEKANIGTPSLYKEGSTWYLFYHGFDSTDCRIGVATGTSLTSLSKYSGNPIINTTTGAWDAGTTGRRSMIRKEGSYYYLAYEVSTDQPYGTAKWSSGIARSTNLLSWTKYSGNPVVPQTTSGFGNDGPEIMQIGGVNYLYVRSGEPGLGPTVRHRLKWKPALLPAAPSNSGCTNVAPASIRWTWKDNSNNETGFKVFADPGAGPPSTQRTTTSANATYWDYTGLTGNTRYCFQVSATNSYGDSTKTLTFTRYSLASPPSIGNNVVSNKTPGTWYPTGTTFVFSNPAGFGIGTHGGNQYRVSKFTYAWNKNPIHSWTGAESTWNASTITLSPTAGDGPHYLHLRSWNGDNLANSTTLDYGPFNYDATAPTGSIVISGGAAYTTSTTVSLTLSASDAASGVSQMRFSNDNTTWSDFEPYSTTKSWQLTANDCTKTVYVQYQDTAGNTSANYSDIIILDTTLPSTVASPEGGVYSGSRNISLTASEPVTIYYTTTGSEPTTGSSVYSAPILAANDMTLRYFAVDAAGNAEAPKKQQDYNILIADGSIAEAKAQANNEPVSLGNKALYLKWNDFAYIQEQDRTSGVRVQGVLNGFEGDLVCLTGVMRTTAHGERYVELTAMTPGDAFTVKPLGINNRDLCGDLLTGLCVTAWGIVKEGSVTGNSFVITDGSGSTGIKVVTKGAPEVNPGEFVTVTGAAGYDGARMIYRK